MVKMFICDFVVVVYVFLLIHHCVLRREKAGGEAEWDGKLEKGRVALEENIRCTDCI